MLRPRPLAWNGVRRGVTAGVEGVWYAAAYQRRAAPFARIKQLVTCRSQRFRHLF
jgi:hypothetical protein